MSSTVSNAPEMPLLDGSLLFSDLANFHMQKNGSLPIYVYANDKVPGSTTEITFLEFGRAAHRLAHALRPARQGPEGQVVMLIANTDTLLHHAVVVGMSIAGLVPFLVSPRNSPAAVADMMKKTNCSRIVTLHHAHQRLVDGILQETPHAQLTVDELPTLAFAFPHLGHEVESHPFVPYPPPTSRPDVNKPAIYIHSSGSTGFPKPIPHTYKGQIHWLTQPGVTDLRHKSPYHLGAMSLPPFHVLGVVMQLYVPFSGVITAAIYPPRSFADPRVAPVIPTGDNILEALQETNSSVLVSVPAFLEEYGNSEKAIEELKKLDLVLFGGGPLPTKIGDKLCAAGVHVGSGYGGTEFGIPTPMPNKEDIADGDWQWMRFGDTVELRWDPQSDGTYELQILTTETNQMAVENLPDVKGYATSDVWVKHPTKEMWRIVGRKDDVIVLASGEKTVPAPIEGVIGASPLVQGAVMFGRERNQVGVLIEPRPEYAIDATDDKAIAELRNQIWPLVEEANKSAPAFSRIFKEMILITSSDKPMARAGKGTVQKKATLKDYEAEIDTLYNTVEASSQSPNGRAGPSAWSGEELEEWLTEHASAISSGREIDPDDDLFAQGFDSLSVTYLRNQLLGALRKSEEANVRSAASRIPQNLVFESPTIKLLAARISSLVTQDASGQPEDFMRQRTTAINAMIEKYSVGLKGSDNGVNIEGQIGDEAAPTTVLLTGSTGGLGSFLLVQLLESPKVERVYALNRPSSTTSIQQRQRSAFLDKGLPLDILESSKLTYVEAEASQANCGLPPSLYETIRDSVTVIIHNAWRLDFNLSLSSFESSIRATRNLVDLGLASPRSPKVRFLFTSSIGSANSWDRARGPFPEEVQLDPSVAVGGGYGESKYVSERIIVKSGLQATSLRIGQIAGGPNGSWATTDWVPSIIKSSITLNALPDSHGVVSWLRPEEVAGAILEIAFTKDTPPPALNIVNPRGAPWADVMVAVRSAVIEKKKSKSDGLPLLPFEQWFAQLEARATGASSEDLANIPAIKLLEFFRLMAHSDQASPRSQPITEAGGMTNFSTTKAQLVSQIMAKMQPIGEAEASSWVRYWSSKEFF
ncbi:hypothetical protein HYDPIDRAFT_114897 [Hydnomerulius pinastri MD-312]|uniref:Carrier domain-containing protein n=1 Tax=Hydnomerulius pinastri MD-312 TaxID=994086 RepID=A0A0C9VW20_9AGAM|nr:hypothetical protein HYDPIDRAFT_114897 [Hydnomerulius pinastri MD-312]